MTPPPQHRRRHPRPTPANAALARQIRSSYAWQQLMKQTVAEEPVCWLRLWGCTLVSTTADHIVPASVDPSIALCRWNVHGACHNCNSRRRDLPLAALATLRQPPRPSDPQRRARRHIAAQRTPAAALAQLFGTPPPTTP